MKTYFAQSIGVTPEDIYTVSVMPCVAKKGERNMELFYGEYAGHDIDAVPVSYTHLGLCRMQQYSERNDAGRISKNRRNGFLPVR